MRFKSRWASAATAPNKTVATASTIRLGANAGNTSGKIGNRIRSKPYTPIFESRPVSSIVTGVGASA